MDSQTDFSDRPGCPQDGCGFILEAVPDVVDGEGDWWCPGHGVIDL